MTAINEADAIFLGSDEVDKVYLGSTLVWEPSVPTWSPADLTGLKIWFDASQLALADGAAVSPWPNLANPSVAGVMVGSPAPTVRTTALNGLRVVRFKPSEGRMRIGLSGDPTGVHATWTLVYIGRMVGPATGRIVNSIYPTGGNLLVGWWNGNMDVCYDNGFVPNAYPPTTTDWKKYAADGNPTIPRTRFFGSGGATLGLIGSTATSAGWGNCFAINGYDPAATPETCDCEVAEVCFYDRQLGGAERQLVETYLYDKWGV